MGQINYLPDRLSLFTQLLTFANAENQTEKYRLAYGAADYDLLTWVEQTTPPETAMLLLTASPETYGDPSYVLYHRAIYHLAPRAVWWAAPVLPQRYPAWWDFTDLNSDNIQALMQQRRVGVVLADGFSQPPLSGSHLAFDQDTWLIFLHGDTVETKPYWPTLSQHQLATVSCQSLIVGCRGQLLLRLVGALLSLFVWGDLLYAIIGSDLPTASISRRLAMVWVWGAGGTSLAIFVALWAGVSLTLAVFTLSGGGIAWWLFQRRTTMSFWVSKISSGSAKNNTKLLERAKVRLIGHKLNLWSLFFSVVILAQSARVAFAASVSPLTDWDAWVNWASKANLIFIEQTLSPNLYHNLARLPTNMDYPLMLPLIETWFYTWLGQIHEPSIGLIAFLFFIALLGLFYHAVRPLTSPTAALGFTALLATIPRLTRPAHSGLADIPLASLTLLALLTLFFTYQNVVSRQAGLSVQIRFSAMAGLSVGLLPWLKNEGWLWAGLISLLWLVGMSIGRKHRLLPLKRATILTVVYLCLAFILPFLWQYFLWQHGTVRFTFLPLTWQTIVVNSPRWPIIVWEMVKRLLNPYWNFVWFFFGITLLIRIKQILCDPAPLNGLLLLTISFLFLTSLTYIFTRFDPYLAHLNNSVERLMLQAVPVTLWWLVGQGVARGWLSQNADEEQH